MNARATALIFSFFTLINSSYAGPFGADSLFEKLKGGWEGRGEFIDQDGNTTRFTETWTGKGEGDSVFSMGGNREMSNDDSHTFEWRYLFNPTTELIECEMTMTTMEETVRFEVTVDDAQGQVSMKAPLGGDGAEISVVNRIEGGKIIGEVKITDASGNQTGTATVEHRRPEAWNEKE